MATTGQEETTRRATLTFDWSRRDNACGIWRCPFDSHHQQTSAADEHEEECQICLHPVPATALLSCRRCRNRQCALCLIKMIEDANEQGPLCPHCREAVGRPARLFLHLIAQVHRLEPQRPPAQHPPDLFPDEDDENTAADVTSRITHSRSLIDVSTRSLATAGSPRSSSTAYEASPLPQVSSDHEDERSWQTLPYVSLSDDDSDDSSSSSSETYYPMGSNSSRRPSRRQVRPVERAHQRRNPFWQRLLFY